MGSDMIYPVWPMFVKIALGVDMTILGLIDGVGDVMVSLSQAGSGYISDRIRRRKVFIWSGYLMGSLSRIGYALSSAWQHLLFFKALDRGGKIRGAPRDAYIADISTERDRGRNFGILRAMDHLGAVSGVVLCILLFSKLGYQRLFILAALPSLIGAGLIFFRIKEKGAPGVKIYKGLTFKDLGRDYWLFLIVSLLFAFGAFSYSFLLIYATEFGFKASFVPVFYLIFSLAASLSSLPFGRLSDRIGRKWVIMTSYALWGMVISGFVYFHDTLSMVLLFLCYGLHKGALEPVQKAFVSELAPLKYRASALGGYQMAVGLCALPASLFAGILWDKVSIFTPLYLSLVFTVMSMVILLFVKKEAS